MDYVVLVAGSKETSGFCEIDSAGLLQTSTYKQSSVKKNAVSLIGRDGAAFSGLSTCQSDYFAVAQAEKPAIVLYQRSKSAPLYQCPMQEIVNCLTSDTTGSNLFSGTRKGFIYVHDVRTGELIAMWQGHLKGISKLQVSCDNQFLITVGEDGLGRCWNIPSILDSSLVQQHGLLKSNKSSENRLLTPFRSWSAHTLPVTDLSLIDFGSCLRAVTCSLDRTVHFYDVLSQSSLAKVTLPGELAAPLECLAISNGLEYVIVGSSTGRIFCIDISVTAAGVSGVQNLPLIGKNATKALANAPSTSTLKSESMGIHSIDAHSLAVSTILVLPDNERFVSGSVDGFVKFYNLFTRQLLVECSPLLQRGPITNLTLMFRSELSSLSIVKTTVASIAPLRKYADAAGVSAALSTMLNAASAQQQQSHDGEVGGTGPRSHTPMSSSSSAAAATNVLEKLSSVVGAVHTHGLTQGSVVLGPGFLPNRGFQVDPAPLRALRDEGKMTGESTASESAEEAKHSTRSRVGIRGDEEFVRLESAPVMVVDNVPADSNENNDGDNAEEEDEEEGEDFMRLEDVDNGGDNEEDDEGDDEEEEEDICEEDDSQENEELRQQLQQKEEEIAQLEEEKERWKTLCEQMKQIIESGKGGSHQTSNGSTKRPAATSSNEDQAKKGSKRQKK